MNADQFLSLAEALRSYALHSGRDLNASNLFVHEMLMRTVRNEKVDAPERRDAQHRDGAASR